MARVLTDLRLREGVLFLGCYKGDEGIEYAYAASPPLRADEALYLVAGEQTELFRRVFGVRK